MSKGPLTARHWILLPIAALAIMGLYHTRLGTIPSRAFGEDEIQPDKVLTARKAQSDVDTRGSELERLSHAFSGVVEKVKPAVVHVQTIRSQDSLPEELRELFAERNVELHPVTGTGSGVVIDSDGYIVTNNHVIAEADVVWVTMVDGRKYKAEVAGTDALTDVAVLKVNADRLRPVKFGDSDQVSVGSLVLAIGSPFRLTHSVSHGIVSALGRSDVQVDIGYQNWIQTDAPINPGNSGGPLINMQGEVIGISVAIATDTGSHQGVGFAIPSNTVTRLTPLLKKGETVVRGYLGVVIRPVEPKFADAYGLDQAGGAFVDDVGPDSPAAEAGLQEEDIILAVNGKPVATRQQLQDLIANIAPGTRVDLAIWRDGERRTLAATVGTQPEGFYTSGTLRDLNHEAVKAPIVRREGKTARPAIEEAGETPSETEGLEFKELGFTVQTLTPRLIQRLKLATDLTGGAVITDVRPTGEAYMAGLMKGEIIVRANGKPVDTATDLRREVTAENLFKGLRLKLRSGDDATHAVLQVR